MRLKDGELAEDGSTGGIMTEKKREWGPCKWCDGGGRITRTMGDGKTVECPMCGGSGDEPELGRRK
jgi:hypothetical protein